MIRVIFDLDLIPFSEFSRQHHICRKIEHKLTAAIEHLERSSPYPA